MTDHEGNDIYTINSTTRYETCQDVIRLRIKVLGVTIINVDYSIYSYTPSRSGVNVY